MQHMGNGQDPPSPGLVPRPTNATPAPKVTTATEDTENSEKTFGSFFLPSLGSLCPLWPQFLRNHPPQKSLAWAWGISIITIWAMWPYFGAAPLVCADPHRYDAEGTVGMASTSQAGKAARWLIVALLAAVAGGLVVEFVSVIRPAAAQVSTGESRSLQAVPGQISRDTYGVFLVDSEKGRMAVYELVNDKSGKKLHLVAARFVAYDLRLDDYNNAEPLPRDVRTLVEQQPSLENATTRPTGRD